MFNFRVWSVRFNFFHDQLILSSSSDCKVLLTCAASVSSETSNEHSDKENMYELIASILFWPFRNPMTNYFDLSLHQIAFPMAY